MRLRDRITKAQRPVVVYEILPPRIIDGTIESYAEKISTLLSRTHIDAINIPEVRAEETRGVRPVEERIRAEPREFGRLLQDSVGIEAIVNRVTVHETAKEQEKWFGTTYEEFGIENYILVGGESSDIDYPGPSIIESASIIEDINNERKSEIFFGGICLPSRRAEYSRMLKKVKNGTEFFTSQVLYDGGEICKMLGQYSKACLDEGIETKRVLLSFAPITTQKNVEFLKWLGVKIPIETEDYLLENLEETKARSMEVSMRILEEILEYVTENNISVPLGLNIEHIMTYNFNTSIELLQKMSKRYRIFCMNSDLNG
jgi:5,10-methylenetetrahydrofolate reductase